MPTVSGTRQDICEALYMLAAKVKEAPEGIGTRYSLSWQMPVDRDEVVFFVRRLDPDGTSHRLCSDGRWRPSSDPFSELGQSDYALVLDGMFVHRFEADLRRTVNLTDPEAIKVRDAFQTIKAFQERRAASV